MLMTNGSLMKLESIAKCSLWSILQCFWPALSNNWSWKPIFGCFESHRFRQVLLYMYLPRIVITNPHMRMRLATVWQTTPFLYGFWWVNVPMEEEKWVLAGPPLVCLDKRTPAAASILLPLLYLNILIMSSSERDTVKTLYSDQGRAWGQNQSTQGVGMGGGIR